MKSEHTKQRIVGYDLARGLAIAGMVFVNFKVVMVAPTDALLYQWLGVLSGKAAALFVVLAGVGMTLMYASAKRKDGAEKIRQVKINLLKRAVFLFLVGLSYYVIWPADILHYYGVYMVIGIVLLAAPRVLLQTISILLVIGYTILLLFFNYETGWDWNSLEYTGFFTPAGFFRNLFLNGFHPVIPWVAFLLTGIWLGRINFSNSRKLRQVALFSIAIYVIFKGLSVFLVSWANTLPAADAKELRYLFGTEPMPPLFFYMTTAASLAVFIIVASIYAGQKFSQTMVVKLLISTGQLALSNYFFHVVVGMLAIELIFGELEQAFPVWFAFFYALAFNLLLIVFSYFWRKKYRRGPLESIMRKITA